MWCPHTWRYFLSKKQKFDNFDHFRPDDPLKSPSTLATLFNHMWSRIVAGIFIPVGNHYFQALANTLQFVAQVCHRLWLVPATDRAFAYITYMSPPHVALVCSGKPQCAATCGWTKWPVCSGPKSSDTMQAERGQGEKQCSVGKSIVATAPQGHCSDRWSCSSDIAGNAPKDFILLLLHFNH